MKKVALIGASGYVGSAILNELLSREYQVEAMVKHPEKIKTDNPNLIVKKIDVSDKKSLEEALKGFEYVISTYNPGWANTRIYEDTLANYPKILDAAKKAGVKRLLIVGGAGTLFVKPGVRLIDAGILPDAWMPGVKSLGEFYLNTLLNESDIDWVFFSPAGNLGDMGAKGPGKRTGIYRLGKDDMIFDKEGNSFISVEDYAKAMVDELAEPAHHKERFTIGY